MENTVIHYLTKKMGSECPLTSHQQNNVDTVVRISKKFHKDACIQEGPEIPITKNLLVLESGHQPNFLPYPGVWKKVFLLHKIREYFNNKDQDTIALFGFADQNLSTARLLYENKVPSVNKQGSKKFGIKIPETEKWKCFNTIQKPARGIWVQELEELRNYYRQYLPRNNTQSQPFLDRIGKLTEILDTSYTRATNMADVNAFAFARICQELFDLPIHFFRYSDVQANNLFFDESKKILDILPHYNTVYNDTIEKKELHLTPVPPDFFPFWYHCSCGGKVALLPQAQTDFKGSCPLCSREFSFVIQSDPTYLKDCMKNMGLSAVARNVIFSEGLGTRLFVSGSGGGLRYGMVANEISRQLAWNIPITVSWKSRDYYIGVVHRAALEDTLRLFNMTYNDLISGLSSDKITHFRKSLLDQMENIKMKPEKKKEFDKYSGLYRSSATQLMITKKTFSTIPSIIDVLVNFDAPNIIHQWNDSMNSTDIQDSGEIVILKKDVCYHQGRADEFQSPDIPRIYHSLDLINEL